VKFREWWRPFAPSFKKEAAANTRECDGLPFMIVTAQVRPEKRSVIPSVTHVDGQRAAANSRKRDQPALLETNREFGKRTGVRRYEYFVQSARRAIVQHLQTRFERSSVQAWMHS